MIVHHTGIITRDIAKSIGIYEKLGYSHTGQTVTDTVQNNTVIFLTSLDKTQTIELIKPLDKTSTVHNFRDGYHHICYDVSDNPDFLSRFKAMKIGRIFTQPMIAPAIDNREIVFALLNNGTFIEFIIGR